MAYIHLSFMLIKTGQIVFISNNLFFFLQWASSLDTLEANRQDKLQLYPPQGYELHRLSKFNDLEKLINFAKKRSCKGDDLFYPMLIKVNDGIIFIFPGKS